MIINLKSQTDLSGFYIVYEGSTNLEKPGWYGLSHMLEHLVCKAIDHLQDDLDRDGISWNAHTTSNEIVFHLTGLDEKVSKWRDDFVKLLTKFNVTKEQFENERKIVLEEYSDSFNNQTEAHFDNLYRKLFNDYQPIGLKKDLENLKYMDILNYFELQYAKPTKIINVSKGKKYKNNLVSFADRSIEKNIEYGNFKTDLELKNEFKDKTSIMLLSPIINEDFAYVKFINSMLSLGLNSPLYKEVREKKGLVYYIQTYLARMNKQGINNIMTQTSNENYDEVIKSIKKVLNNPDKYLTKERFNVVKDYYSVRKQKDEILRFSSVNQWIQPEGWDIYDILEDVNMKKIKEIYNKYFKFGDLYISSDKKEFK